MYGSPPIKSLEKHKWNIRIVRAKINSEKLLIIFSALLHGCTLNENVS